MGGAKRTYKREGNIYKTITGKPEGKLPLVTFRYRE
jgi:hypothetical protein